MKVTFRSLAALSSILLGILSLGTPLQAQDNSVSTTEKASSITSLSIPQGVSITDARQIVLTSLINREWTVKEKTDTKVTAYLKHRRNEAELYFTITEGSIEIQGWGYQLSKNGGREKPELPNGWINFLKKDITKGLNLKTVK